MPNQNPNHKIMNAMFSRFYLTANLEVIDRRQNATFKANGDAKQPAYSMVIDGVQTSYPVKSIRDQLINCISMLVHDCTPFRSWMDEESKGALRQMLWNDGFHWMLTNFDNRIDEDKSWLQWDKVKAQPMEAELKEWLRNA